jgi:hypothetical protein
MLYAYPEVCLQLAREHAADLARMYRQAQPRTENRPRSRRSAASGVTAALYGRLRRRTRRVTA